MKRLILSAAAFTMLLASCAKDEAAVANGEALVTFNVATTEIGTRVYGDGVTAHDLEYAIYEKGNYDQPLIQKEIAAAFPDNTMSTSFTEKLVKGKTYIALFWADAEVDPYTVDWANQTVKITDPAALASQDENLDAFFKCHEIVVGQDAQTETIELRRPFAQLNIGTSDTAAAATAGLVVAQTEVAVSAYTQMNLLDGTVDPQSKVALTYQMANIPTGENATFTINEKTYDHLSMNYLLVGPKELVDVTFTVNDGTQNINTSSFAKVPVERNYKTFIIGELLTSAVNFDVYILPDWEKPDYIYTAVFETVTTGADMEMTDPDGYIDEPEQVATIANMQITAEDTAIVVDELPADSRGVLYVHNTVVNAETFMALNEYVTVIVRDSFLNVETLFKNNTGDLSFQLILDNVYVNGTLLTEENIDEYIEEVAFGTVQVNFPKNDEGGNEGGDEGGNEGGEGGEGGNEGGEGGNEGGNEGGEGGNEGGNEGGEGEQATVNYSDIINSLGYSSGVEGAKYLANATYTNFVFNSTTPLHVYNTTFKTFVATANSTLFLENVTFTESVDLSAMTENFTLYVENCTVAGTKVTAKNIKSLMKYNGTPINVL